MSKRDFRITELFSSEIEDIIDDLSRDMVFDHTMTFEKFVEMVTSMAEIALVSDTFNFDWLGVIDEQEIKVKIEGDVSHDICCDIITEPYRCRLRFNKFHTKNIKEALSEVFPRLGICTNENKPKIKDKAEWELFNYIVRIYFSHTEIPNYHCLSSSMSAEILGFEFAFGKTPSGFKLFISNYHSYEYTEVKNHDNSFSSIWNAALHMYREFCKENRSHVRRSKMGYKYKYYRLQE